MLLSAEEWGQVVESDPPITPYMDEVLRRSPGQYEEFIARLFANGMIGFCSDPKEFATPFFVWKKDGR